MTVAPTEPNGGGLFGVTEDAWVAAVALVLMG